MSDGMDISKYAYTFEPMFTLEPDVMDEVTFHFMDKNYTLPAVEHKQYDAMSSLFAVVVELHNRVQALEAELKGQDDE
jgi:hypothetical protein